MWNPLALFKRIETRPHDGRVRVELDGVVVAESERALVLCERGLRDRHYLPREDVRADLLPSDKVTYCRLKGGAIHYSVRVGDHLHENVAWSYKNPFDDVGEIAGLVAFYDERAVVTADAR